MGRFLLRAPCMKQLRETGFADIASNSDGHVRAWSTANWGCLKWRVSSHPVSKVVSDLNGTKVLAAVQGEPALALIDLASTGSASTTVVKLADVVGPVCKPKTRIEKKFFTHLSLIGG